MLTKIYLFGGNFCFVFHATSTKPLPPSELMRSKEGFFAVVDFYLPKREGRIALLAAKVQPHVVMPTQLKQTHEYQGKAPRWWIYEADGTEREVKNLTAKQKELPLRECISEELMAERVASRWAPERDPRI